MNLYLLCMSGKVLTGGKASSKQRENLVTTWWRGYSAALKALPPPPLPFPLPLLPIFLKNFILSKKKTWRQTGDRVTPPPQKLILLFSLTLLFLRTFLHCFFYWLFVYTSYFKSILGHPWPLKAPWNEPPPFSLKDNWFETFWDYIMVNSEVSVFCI